MSHAEQLNRERKAAKLIGVIDEHYQRLGIKEPLRILACLPNWTDEMWAQTALLCGKHPPSEQTKALIRRRYIERAVEAVG